MCFMTFLPSIWVPVKVCPWHWLFHLFSFLTHLLHLCSLFFCKCNGLFLKSPGQLAYSVSFVFFLSDHFLTIRLLRHFWHKRSACAVCFLLRHIRRHLSQTITSAVQSLSRVRLLRPRGLQPARLLCAWDSPGKSTGVDCHFLLQGIFPTQELNPGLLRHTQILYQLNSEGRPTITLMC